MRKLPKLIYEGSKTAVADHAIGIKLQTHVKTFFITPRVLSIEIGPSGGPELLCLIRSDVVHQRFWYGAVRRHPQRQVFSACIVYMHVLVDGDAPDVVFERFDYWTRVRLEYEVCKPTDLGSIYAEAPNFEKAVDCLATMIDQFGNDCLPEVGADISSNDFKLLEVYGMTDHRDKNGGYPKPF